MQRPALLRGRLPAFLLFVLSVAVVEASPGTLSSDPAGLWRPVDEAAVVARRASTLGVSRAGGADRFLVPSETRTFLLDRRATEARLAAVPQEAAGPLTEVGEEIALPTPSGGFARFLIVESPLMEPKLAGAFPELRTFLVQGIDDPAASGRLDLTPTGFRGVILTPEGSYFIDPYWKGDAEVHQVYYRRKFADLKKAAAFSCGVIGGAKTVADLEREAELFDRSLSSTAARPTGATLRTYRAAVAATAEYSAAVSGTTPGNKLTALSNLITTVNRVSAIYERDLSIRLVLVANNDQLVFLDGATDGYTNSDGASLLTENQTKLDTVIGSANYDIGHVFSTGGGGLAGLGVVCRAGLKAQGETGSPTPRGDPYDVDYVAHEMGHQFGGNHPFNGTSSNCSGGNRNATTAYEVGSGTTIMAYAGICSPQDIAPNSDDYFHTVSYDEIDTYTSTTATCSVSTVTGNSVPVIAVLTNRVIPANTPFALTASATDANGDTLTYCWEEFDRGAAQDPTAAPRDNGSSPIFRSFHPSRNPTRLFPSLTYILNNANVPPATVGSYASGEFLPTTNRTMTYRVTVRDNRAGGGGSNWASMTVQSVNTGAAFAITSNNTTSTIAAGASVPLTWNVAGTTANGINCSNVRITLSTDGGQTFPIELLASTPNDGSESVVIPNVAQVATSQARLKVEAVGNVFFDINDANLTITSSVAAPTFTVSSSVTVVRGAATATTSTVGTVGGTAPFTATVLDAPSDATVTAAVTGTSVAVTAQAACALTTTNTSRTYPMTVVITDGNGSKISRSVNLIVQPNAAPSVGTYAAASVSIGGGAVVVTPSAGPTDTNGNLPASPFTVTPATLPGGGTVTINQTTGAVTITPTAGTTAGARTIRVAITDSCGATLLREFTATAVLSGSAIAAGGAASITLEGCAPTNNAIDPGESVTVSLPLLNSGGASTTGAVTAVLLPTGGVTNPSGVQSYGTLAAGGSASRTFSFTASGTCGGTLTLTLDVQDTVRSYGTVTYVLTFGVSGTNGLFSQNFDSVVAPALPSGWTSAVASGAMVNWATSTTTPDTAPNAVFATPVTTSSEVVLTSPSIAIPAGAASLQLQFKHRWSLETNYDGGVLEIATGAGGFADILAAGGSFAAGGYTSTIDTGFGNPLAGRSAWSGSANAAYTTTTVNLPSSLAGQSVRFRFRLGSDTSTVASGTTWRIDSLVLQSSGSSCASCAVAPTFTSAAPAVPVVASRAYSHQFTASGSPAATFSLTGGTLPPGLSLTTGGLLSGTVTAPGNGSYPGITVTAANGTLPNATQTFSLPVVTRATDFIASYGYSGANALDDADPDGDGTVNLLEYAIGSVPNAPDRAAIVADTVVNAGSTYLRLTFPRSSLATDLSYIVETAASPDAVTWTEVARSDAGAALSGAGALSDSGTAPSFTCSARDTTALGGVNRYIRLRIVAAP